MVNIIGLITLGCGLYCLYGAYMMRFKGQITHTILLPKNVDLRKCKDLEGYRREMQIPLFLLGITVTIYSFVDLYNTSVGGADLLFGIMFILSAVAVVYFIVRSRACNKKYFGIL